MGDFETEGGSGWNIDVVCAGTLEWILVLCGCIMSAFIVENGP